ncbi:MAG: anthranilate phosphoribosyltransferase [bacterium]
MLKEAISKVVERQDLSSEEANQVMNEIMSGKGTDAQIAAFITALRMKGETVEEITEFTRIMREKAAKVHVNKPAVDTCGTGGDRSFSFNISTAAAFVAAGAGVTIAKHGNRSVSSKSGSADCFQALGINISASLSDVEKNINEIGIGFLFAPMLHSSMKYAIGPRREIGIRTVFNILGPMTNPAGAKAQLLGVYDASLMGIMIQVLKNLESTHVLVVHGEDGLDEISITGPTEVSELKEGKITHYTIKPEDFGMKVASLDDIKGGTAEENARVCIDILNKKQGPQRDITLLNAGAVIYVADMCDSIAEGIQKAAEAIDSGAALAKLEQYKSR